MAHTLAAGDSRASASILFRTFVASVIGCVCAFGTLNHIRVGEVRFSAVFMDSKKSNSVKMFSRISTEECYWLVYYAAIIVCMYPSCGK